MGANVGGETAVRAARQAAWLFALSGLLAVAAAPVETDRATALVLVGFADLVAAAVIATLPWRRWPEQATLAVVPPAIAVIAGAHALGLVPVRSYGVFFVLLFAWIGNHHPRRTALALAPVIALGYGLPLALTHAQPPLDPRAIFVAMAIGVLVAETMAHNVELSTSARFRAEHSARTFETVGQATSQLLGLEAPAVLDAVADAVMDLGYDGVSLANIDWETGTFSPAHARGITLPFAGRRFPITSGLTAEVIAAAAPVVIPDYQQLPTSHPIIRQAGCRTTIGIPVATNGVVVAVLMASYGHVHDVQPEDVEALRIVAAHAGSALSVLGQLAVEQQRSADHLHTSLTDDLTGIGNRRQAQNLLEDIRPGGSVALIDIDRFKLVNDTHGHATGDQVLHDLASFLASQLRGGDQVVRYGGEEFLVVLPDTPAHDARRVLERLRCLWVATDPPVTFSVGAAEHRAGHAAATTVARADEALYQAKGNGRNQVRLSEDGPAVRAALSPLVL